VLGPGQGGGQAVRLVQLVAAAAVAAADARHEHVAAAEARQLRRVLGDGGDAARVAPAVGQARQFRLRQHEHAGLRHEQLMDEGQHVIVARAAIGQRRRERVEHERHVGIVGHDLRHRRDLLQAGQGADLDGGHRHVLEQHARLFHDERVVGRLDVVHARGIRHEQARHDREGVAAMHGEDGHVGLDAQRPDRVGGPEREDEWRRLVLHSG